MRVKKLDQVCTKDNQHLGAAPADRGGEESRNEPRQGVSVLFRSVARQVELAELAEREQDMVLP